MTGCDGMECEVNTHAVDIAASHGLASCRSCGKLQPVRHERCLRCDARLSLRKPHSLQRTWALTIAAVVLYFPANMLPIMRSTGFQGGEENTILGGVIMFWKTGAYPIAIVIFSASVIIPVLKVFAIIVLCLAARTGANPRVMTKVFRVTELVGRWSMVDVFVVAILVAMVQFGNLMTIEPGPAALAFAGVVGFTMLAAISFDPRLIWDAARGSRGAWENL